MLPISPIACSQQNMSSDDEGRSSYLTRTRAFVLGGAAEMWLGAHGRWESAAHLHVLQQSPRTNAAGLPGRRRDQMWVGAPPPSSMVSQLLHLAEPPYPVACIGRCAWYHAQQDWCLDTSAALAVSLLVTLLGTALVWVLTFVRSLNPAPLTLDASATRVVWSLARSFCSALA